MSAAPQHLPHSPLRTCRKCGAMKRERDMTWRGTPVGGRIYLCVRCATPKPKPEPRR